MQFCRHVIKTALVGRSDRSKIVTVKLQRLAVTWSLYKTAIYGCCTQVNMYSREETELANIRVNREKENMPVDCLDPGRVDNLY